MTYPKILEGVDYGEVILIKKWEKIRTIKRELIMMGFTHQIAMYGVLTNKETEVSHYKRIDVLSDEPFTPDSFTRVYDFIMYVKNPAKYSIWVYHTGLKTIKEAFYLE